MEVLRQTDVGIIFREFRKKNYSIFMENIRLNKLERFALLICGLCLGGMTIGNVTQKFRFSDLRIIYHFGWISCYILVLSTFIWSIVNAILIVREKKYSLKKKVMWSIISLLPILYFTIMITIAMSRDK